MAQASLVASSNKTGEGAGYTSRFSPKEIDDHGWVDAWRMEKMDRQRWPATEWKTRFVLLSKKLSSTLRHTSVKEGFNMRSDGCIRVSELLGHFRYKEFSEEEIVTAATPGHNKKERFELIREGGQVFIRARQGHSQVVADCIDETELNTQITVETAPAIAIHGTFANLLEPIRRQGLKRYERQHIHMAPGLPSDGDVISGCRTGTDVYLYVDVAAAIRDGIEFMRSGNEVILTPGIEGVLPPKYLVGAVGKRGNVIFGKVPRDSKAESSKKEQKALAKAAPEKPSAPVQPAAPPSQLTFSEKEFLKHVKALRAILKIEALPKLDAGQKKKLESKGDVLAEVAEAEKLLPPDSDLREKNKDIICLLEGRET